VSEQPGHQGAHQPTAPRPAEYAAQLATMDPNQGMGQAPTPVPLEGPIQDLASAYRYAFALAQSNIIPRDLRDRPHNVLVIVLYGQLLGIPPVVALNTIGVTPGGKPILEGKLLLSKVREAGHTPKIEHGDNECTVTITRGDTGEQHSESFTLAMAQTAELITITAEGEVRARSNNGKKLPWETYTQRMLMWRALGWCVDVICPEVKMGFMVEGEESTPVDDKPTLAVAARRRAGKDTTEEPAAQLSEEQIAAQIADLEASRRPGQYDQNPPCQDAGDTVTPPPAADEGEVQP
jgi:hypothetical protein